MVNDTLNRQQLTYKGMQTVVFEYPPMIDEIDKAFHVRHKSVVYSWGKLLYNPRRMIIPEQLLGHEAVHGEQQLTMGSIEGWWTAYIEQPDFRLQEEVFAHAVEYQVWKLLAINRKERRSMLDRVSQRLAGPLYGNMTSIKKARKLILHEIQQYGAKLGREQREHEQDTIAEIQRP